MKYHIEEINNKKVLDYKIGDVNGDGILEQVYLLGYKPFDDSEYVKNISLFIISMNGNENLEVKVSEYGGYGFSLYLGDFTSDNKEDILIRGFSGDSGRYSYSYIFSYNENIYKLIFNGDNFEKEYKYLAKYLDQYKVEVISENLNKKYILDITLKEKGYLENIYDDIGRVKKDEEITVLGIGLLNPINLYMNKKLSLYIQQRIIGQSNADNLGIVQTVLEWNGKEFLPVTQMIGVLGTESIVGLTRYGVESEVDLTKVNFIDNTSTYDEKIDKFVYSTLMEEKGKSNTKYAYNKIDLNDDGVDEIIIYIVGSKWCGSGGCTALIAREEDNQYKLITKVTVLTPPIIVTNDKTNGYKNIIVYSIGGGIKSGYRILKYDGKRYPANPSLEESIPIGATVEGIGLMANYDPNKNIVNYKYEEDVEKYIPNYGELTSARVITVNNRTYIIGTYRYKGEIYMIVFENINGKLKELDTIKAEGYDLGNVLIASIKTPGEDNVVIGWQIAGIWYKLDLREWDGMKFKKILEENINFSKFDIEDLDNDNVDEIILWKHDTGKAYKIDIYKYENGTLKNVPELYEKYFGRVVKYYETLVNEVPESPVYWYYLLDAQYKAGMVEEAEKTLEKVMTFKNVYPSKEEINNIIEKLKEKQV